MGGEGRACSFVACLNREGGGRRSFMRVSVFAADDMGPLEAKSR